MKSAVLPHIQHRQMKTDGIDQAPGVEHLHVGQPVWGDVAQRLVQQGQISPMCGSEQTRDECAT